jgi:hypothetical protein
LKGAQLAEFLDGKDEAPTEFLISDDKKTKIPNLEFTIYVAKQ